MASTTGRRVVEYLTNKSGGGVVAGDVVVIDTTNNESFTTSTAGGFTGTIGVAQETIANNAAGRVLTAGYAALVTPNASVTRGNYGKTHTVAKQATDAGSSRTAGAFCQFLTGGTTPSAHLFGLADASTSSSGVPAGTSFPGSPATNDLYYRTDRSLLYTYDGTRWLTVDLYTLQFGVLDALGGTSNNQDQFAKTWSGTYQMYLVDLLVTCIPLTTNTGSHFWTFQLKSRQRTTNTQTNVGSSTSTAADTVDQYKDKSVSLNTVLATTEIGLQLNATKTGSPGALYYYGFVTYRLIG